MSISELITPFHLERQALIYIRQSSPHQVLTNQESRRLQYALRQRALECGWSADAIEVIDADQSRTARTTQGREGFKEIVARVTLDQVGIIFSYDVTRMARNCTDWYQVLDLCGFRHCLIGDRDGIYDPATINGRLLLGVKGQLSELELHTIKGRLTAGLLNKAQRGELALTLPVGLARDPLGRVVKRPDREVQDRISLVFTTFLRVRSLAKVVRSFNEQGFLVPRRDPFGDVVWRCPTVSSVGAILKNPAYAGSFVYGRTRTERTGPDHTPVQKPLPITEWRIHIRDVYPPYIDWATFEKIQAMIRDNHSEYDRNKTRGVPRPGKALLHGLVYCGECGHKMVVQYKGGTQYLCNSLRQQTQGPVCQRLRADPVDDHVVRLFFEALAPAELDVYDRVMASLSEEREQVRRARRQQLERLRYQARLAERQYQKADPDNRLVAGELERRWETSLRELKQAEEAIERMQDDHMQLDRLDPETRRMLTEAGRQIPQWWQTDRFSREQKKALLRCLIDKVVVHRIAPDRVHCRVVWRGGETTDADVAVTVGSWSRLSEGREIEESILRLARQGKSDEEIAQYLTERGHHSPRHTTVLCSSVRIVRLRHGLLRDRRQSHPRQIPGFLTVPQLTAKLGLERSWIYDRIHNGTIQVTPDAARKLYLFPDTPETLARFRKLRAGKLNSLRF
ncbi:MAG TPA: recombinase family protein [Isosphaeraceae bacterium]|nr:recombinase family protein [Isosphaeraceae bacterium]